MKSSTRMLVLSFLVFSPQIALADPEKVGDLGDPDRIHFVGNTTYSTKQLQSELGSDLEMLLAADPAAPFDELMRTLKRRLRDGFVNRGFADATVTAKYDESTSSIAVRIVEGQRYQCGKIDIKGTSTIPVDRLLISLTSRRDNNDIPNPGLFAAKSKRPLWQVGKPASLASGYWRSQKEHFQKVFQSLGYYNVQFTVGARKEVDGTATLVLAIQDEGLHSVLGKVEVLGVKKNSVEDVIRFVDLAPGSVLDSELKSRLEQKFRGSARFVKHEVQIVPPPSGNGPSNLKIDLFEYDDAPPLSQDFSVQEQTMVRLAHWLNNLESFDDDVEIRGMIPLNSELDLKTEAPNGTFIAKLRVVLSHRQQGFLIQLRVVELPDIDVSEIWLHVNSKFAGICSPRHSIRFEAKDIGQSVIGTVDWSASLPDAQGRMSRLMFGLGMKSSSGSILRTSAAPVAVLREAHLLKDKLRIDDGILTIDDADLHTEIACATGRLIKLSYAMGPQYNLAAESGSGLYQKCAAEYQQLASACRVIESGEAPISNLLSFVASSFPDRLAGPTVHSPKSLASLAHVLLKRGAFHAFDELLIDLFNMSDDNFVLPPEIDPRKASKLTGWVAMILPATRRFVPNPSWAWTVSREFVLAISRRSARSEQTIGQLIVDPKTGPIANLTSAYVFGLMSPKLKTAFARQGLTRLKREHFQSDFEPFLREDSPIGRVLLAVAQTLQEMDDDEIEFLVQQVTADPVNRRLASQVLRGFPAHRSDRPFDALRSVFDDAWEPLIEPYIRALLNSMAN